MQMFHDMLPSWSVDILGELKTDPLAWVEKYKGTVYTLKLLAAVLMHPSGRFMWGVCLRVVGREIVLLFGLFSDDLHGCLFPA